MAKGKTQEKKKQGTGESLRSFLIAIGIALTLRWGVAEAYVIPSGSMLPSLLIHDHIFISKLVYGIRVPFSKTWLVHFRSPQRGEVIVFKDPRDNSTFLVKRVIGIPGDKIAYRDNRLFLNDAPVETGTPDNTWDYDFVRDEDVDGSKSQHEHLYEKEDGHRHSVLHRIGHVEMPPPDGLPESFTVPPESLFMMGDHRDNSADSRYWGFAPEKNVLGKAMFVWLSCDEALPVVNIGCNPLSIRWRRLFHGVN